MYTCKIDTSNHESRTQCSINKHTFSFLPIPATMSKFLDQFFQRQWTATSMLRTSMPIPKADVHTFTCSRWSDIRSYAVGEVTKGVMQ